MNNKRLWFGILVMTLVFGMVVPAYVYAQTDTRLNGTWTWKIKDNNFIIKYYSGNYEISNEYGIPYNKGTYTISNDKITHTPTHFFRASRWYSKGEGIDGPIFDQFTYNYVVNGNKLTWIENGETATLTLVNRDVKFIQSIESSGNVSLFPGRWYLIEGPRYERDFYGRSSGFPEDVELFKDGTGTVLGRGITWKVENGRFHILSNFLTFSAYYNITGSTVIFTEENGRVAKYQKK